MSEIETVVRFVQVTVFGDNYTEDRSVGLNFGPDDVWAEKEDGSNFELTEKEQEEFGIKLAEIEQGNLDWYEENCGRDE